MPGGDLLLTSAIGNVIQDAGSTIDISAGNAAGGSISATALSGTVALNGTILFGSANAGFTAGSLSVRSGTMSQAAFDALNATLNAGGVTGGRSFRDRQRQPDDRQ